MLPTDFWSGSGGAAVGAAAAAAIALFVLYRSKTHSFEQFRAQLNEDAARRITSALIDLYEHLEPISGGGYTPGDHWFTRHRERIATLVSTTRLDVPLIVHQTMRNSIYSWRLKAEEAELVARKLGKQYERGVMTEDEYRGELSEATSSVRFGLAYLISDLDRYRAYAYERGKRKNFRGMLARRAKDQLKPNVIDIENLRRSTGRTVPLPRLIKPNTPDR